MKKSILALATSMSAGSTELYIGAGSKLELLIGTGSSFMADFYGEKFYSLTLQEGGWKYNISHWEAYYRSAWDTQAHPTWENTAL